MNLWWGVVALGVVLVLLAAYGSWTAGRLDRLHHRVATARSSLETELARRSALVAELAGSGVLDPASSLLLLDAAHRARCATDDEREQRESALSRAVAATLGGAPRGGVATSDESPESFPPGWRGSGGGAATGDESLEGFPPGWRERGSAAGTGWGGAAEAEPWAEELAVAMRRVQLARRFHNDIVVSARELRRRRLVTWLRLAGHAPMPRTIELEDGG